MLLNAMKRNIFDRRRKKKGNTNYLTDLRYIFPLFVRKGNAKKKNIFLFSRLKLNLQFTLEKNTPFSKGFNKMKQPHDRCKYRNTSLLAVCITCIKNVNHLFFVSTGTEIQK